MKSKTSKQVFTIGFSPCPNDCFVFNAMLHGKIDTEGLGFKPIIQDIEALNKKAFKQKLDISKLSFFTYAALKKQYTLLDAGSALGFGVGPLVVATSKRPLLTSTSVIAIPGKHTTANLLFSLAYPDCKNKKEVLFSEIENAVLQGKADAGVIIHESRFTYKQKGLKKIIDLGDWWEHETKAPIPLGCIAVKSSYAAPFQEKINRVIRRSVEYAFLHPGSSKGFIKKHAQEMNDEVIKKHIQLYVNEFSLSLGKQGHQAVDIFLKKVKQLKN